jgi:hypothetical protein
VKFMKYFKGAQAINVWGNLWSTQNEVVWYAVSSLTAFIISLTMCELYVCQIVYHCLWLITISVR